MVSAGSRLSRAAVLVAVGVVVTGCGGSRSKPTSTSVKTPAARDQWGTVWLCRPGLAENPCAFDRTTTVVRRGAATRVEPAVPASNPAIDCFYVYPTVSGQPTLNADLTAGIRERAIAIAQASRFSQACRVYAPVYRQVTLGALLHPRRITIANALVAYESVRSAFHDYMAHFNHSRGIVFIGHSQGAIILTRLLKQEVDGSPAVRRRLVSALLLGGNVTIPKGKRVGGDFARIPACGSSRQTGCVVAYSSFASKPSKQSQFGRAGSDAGFRLLAPHKLSPGLRIMCVNPTALAGGTGSLEPYIPSLVLALLPAGRRPPIPSTPWISSPGEYTARCESSGGATWLQVTRVGSTGRWPDLTRLAEPAIGLHILDVNLALGNLVRLVHEEAIAYRHR
jgi:hypothetical protein